MFITPVLKPRVAQQIDQVELFLETFKETLINPVVAGGAPRDWFFGNPARDIDIFVEAGTDLTSILKFYENLENSFTVTKTKAELPAHYQSPYISSVMDVCTSGKTKIQLVVLEEGFPAATVTDNFPISISKITYKNYSIDPSEEFLYSVRHARLTVDVGVDPQLPYIQKIRAYFHTYKLVTQRRGETRFTGISDIEDLF